MMDLPDAWQCAVQLDSAAATTFELMRSGGSGLTPGWNFEVGPGGFASRDCFDRQTIPPTKFSPATFVGSGDERAAARR